MALRRGSLIMSILELGIAAVERRFVPDWMTRAAIRRLCGERLRESRDASPERPGSPPGAFDESLHSGPIALVPHKANEQHYELPPDFFGAVLGHRRKYSCCFWSDDSTTLDAAEDAALDATCQRAEIADGQEILELGCGWGSLSLWMAERYPDSRITAVSNSRPQREFIEAAAASRGLSNLRVLTADMNQFVPEVCHPSDGRFDRVVSVEMFEHMRNYELLLARIAAWLRPGGKLFVHIFCHRHAAYPFESEGTANWMGRHFFTGGIMPSENLLRRFDRDLKVTRRWTWNGWHYRRTAEAWLANLDARRRDVLPILQSTYGKADGRRWLYRWRMFLLAVAELFGYAGGEEWFVAHYLMEHSPSFETRS